MKAIKSCVNQECVSYIHKTKYNDAYVYCPMCGQKLSYVCADCWTCLPHSTERYCEDCEEKRRKRREQQQDKIIKKGTEIVETATKVVAATAVVVNNGKKVLKAINKK